MSDYDDPRLPERFWRDVHPEPITGCWLWGRSLTAAGYGRYRVGGHVYAHRLTWTALRGAIPDGLQIDHLCRNRACCNPDHLEPVTQRENTMRSPYHGKKTHCPQGHALAGANIRWHHRRRGYLTRECRECDLARKRLSTVHSAVAS